METRVNPVRWPPSIQTVGQRTPLNEQQTENKDKPSHKERRALTRSTENNQHETTTARTNDSGLKHVHAEHQAQVYKDNSKWFKKVTTTGRMQGSHNQHTRSV